jgi:hypothetical protein
LWPIDWIEELPQRLTALVGLVAAGGYILTVATVALFGSLIWWRRTRVRRQRSRFEREAQALRNAGTSRRLGLARRCQRQNVQELAVTVAGQLEAVKAALHPCLYQRATVVIEQSVKEVDFDRLYALYDYFVRSGNPQKFTGLEAILDRRP